MMMKRKQIEPYFNEYNLRKSLVHGQISRSLWKLLLASINPDAMHLYVKDGMYSHIYAIYQEDLV